MQRQISFSTTAFGGFEKKSVLNYIDELCEQNQKTLAELNEKIAELEQKNSDLSKTVEQLNEQVEGFQKKAITSTERSRSLQRTIDELSEEIARQQDIGKERDQALKQHQEKSRQLILRAETLEYKGRKYDEAMHRIGQTFAAATQSADDIVKAAEVKASRMTAATIESIQGLAEQISTFKGDIGTLRGTLQQSLVELEERLDGMDNSISQLGFAVKAIDQSVLTGAEVPATLEEGASAQEETPELAAAPEIAAPQVDEPAAKPTEFDW